MEHLGAPFAYDEIKAVVHHMHVNASPGPDGFGPLFFKVTWPITSPSIVWLFEEFYNNSAELSRINRSYLVLHPKKNDTRQACDFRPIALQNTSIKCLSKVLTTRLQSSIPDLVSADQASFILGRFIADSFAYAADLLHCCHRRGAPTLILKLDFHKVFDCVNWESLDRILHHRGFPSMWCTWVYSLLDSGKTSVLLNGTPGGWIDCRTGLRQGDPLSPYLFIIVADVLRRLLHNHAHSPSLQHPLVDASPCPVLQYVDDTLIFLRCNAEAVVQTKHVLGIFEMATGLSINYHKTTFLPINVPPSVALDLASTFGTTVSTFPQPYLGLPLSPHKLTVFDCLPLISSVDKHLSRWSASLLNRAGRLTLSSAVLSSIPLERI